MAAKAASTTMLGAALSISIITSSGVPIMGKNSDKDLKSKGVTSTKAVDFLRMPGLPKPGISPTLLTPSTRITTTILLAESAPSPGTAVALSTRLHDTRLTKKYQLAATVRIRVRLLLTTSPQMFQSPIFQVGQTKPSKAKDKLPVYEELAQKTPIRRTSMPISSHQVPPLKQGCRRLAGRDKTRTHEFQFPFQTKRKSSCDRLRVSTISGVVKLFPWRTPDSIKRKRLSS